MNIPLEEILKEIGIAAAVTFPLFIAINYFDSWAQKKAREYRIKEIVDYARFYNGFCRNNESE